MCCKDTSWSVHIRNTSTKRKSFFMTSRRQCVVGSLGIEGSQVGDTANVIVSGKDTVAQWGVSPTKGHK